MHFKFDIDNRSLLKTIDDKSIKSYKIVFPDKYPVTIDFYKSGEPYALNGAIKTVIKEINEQLGQPLVVTEIDVVNSNTANFILNLSTSPMAEFVPEFGEKPVALEFLALSVTGFEVASWTVFCDISRRYAMSNEVAVEFPDFKATQQEAEAGINNTKWMTPLRTRQSLEAVGIELIG